MQNNTYSSFSIADLLKTDMSSRTGVTGLLQLKTEHEILEILLAVAVFRYHKLSRRFSA